jgi:tetratricopeptide (TPR) repeat protein
MDKTQPNSAAIQLEHAIHLAKSGQKVEARDTLRQLVALQPVNQAAWLWLSAITLDKQEAESALAQARKINPNHPAISRAEQWLAKRFSAQAHTKQTAVIVTPEPVVAKTKIDYRVKVINILGIGLVLCAAVIGVVVLLMGLIWEVQASESDAIEMVTEGEVKSAPIQLEAAWTNHDWPQVITILEERQGQAEPTEKLAAQLAQAYLQYGIFLRHQGLVDKAIIQFEQALILMPEQQRTEQELDLASNYLTGKHAYQEGEWSAAVTALEAVYTVVPEYINVKDLLFSAYYNQGLALKAADNMVAARDTLAAAIALRPDLAEPRLHLAELEYALTPESPPSVPISLVPIEDRLVVVGIAEQRMYVYEGDQKVFDFIVSTGEPGRETAMGEFEIQNKIDVAYASTWNLDMPYWMGIYWSGPLQNGIHSLPTVKHTGQTLWDGYLGQRVSYGSVILGDEDAATLYSWAEVGTKVKIVPSLADWSSEEWAQ